MMLENTIPIGKKGDYAEFVDETDENQGVVVRRSDGTPVIYMSLETWLAIRTPVKVAL